VGNQSYAGFAVTQASRL